MSRLEKLSPSEFEVVTSLSSRYSGEAINAFYNLLRSCAGPSGKVHVVTNNCGGHITLTSSCQRLLAAIAFSRPELKLIVNSVQAHLRQHADCGLFMTCTCLNLVRLSSQSTHSPHLFQRMHETFLEMILDYFKSHECAVTVKADFSDLHVLLAYVRSIFNSKSLLNTRKEDTNAIAELIVKCFVESIPTETCHSSVRHCDGVYIIGKEKEDIRNSRMVEGLLLEYPALSSLRGQVPVKARTVSENETDSFIRTALITCSMSGDVEELVDALFEVTAQQDRQLEQNVICRMEQFCDSLVDNECGIVLCQKVVHPKLKAKLKSRDIIAVDRLGSTVIPYLRDLTGATPISSVISTTRFDVKDKFGVVKSIEHVVEGKKSYLHLSQSSSSVISLVICSQLEEQLAELKICAKTALRGLFSLSKEPLLLCGAGCWQSHCSQLLFRKVNENWSSISKSTGFTKTQIFSALTVFRSSLHQWVVALSDKEVEDTLVSPTTGHVWRASKGRQLPPSSDTTLEKLCCCGLRSVAVETLQTFNYLSSAGAQDELCDYEERDDCSRNVKITISSVLDNYLAATEALKNAVVAANLVLSVSQFITDKN